MIESVADHIPKIRSVDAAAAVLFHLGGGFRRGVTSMIAPQIGRMNGSIEYLPAVYVGGARPQAEAASGSDRSALSDTVKVLLPAVEAVV